LMPLFVCRKWEGIVIPKEEQELKWVYSSELKNYPMPPADKPLIPILRDWI
jgi:8-oxo-dGTP diphosphatase